MALWRRRWQIAPAAPPAWLQHYPDVHSRVLQILYNRGMTTPETIQAFLAEEGALENPWSMAGMHEAVFLIRQIIFRNLPIAVYGDYDVDGVTATAILVETLQALGAQVRAYIPDRVEEGYGLNVEALQTLADVGTRLLITVDCGIRSLEEVALARRLGLQVIVTDHHHVGAALPSADVILNPRRPDCAYPFPDLAGAGVAFKLAQALLRANHQTPLATTQNADLCEDDLLDLAALGTVADMVPLLGENHVIARRGLRKLNEGRRPGLAALMQISNVHPGKITASTIGFALAPRLNAAGRIGEASLAFDLLVAPDLSTSLPLAHELEELNHQRQDLTTQVQEATRAMVLQPDDNPPLFFAVADDFPSGIIGLAAGRLVEEFYRPVIVVERGEPFSRGSARSIPEFHITQALDSMADLLERYGGHAAAAGFTVRTENLPELQARLLALAHEQLEGVTLTPTLQIDLEAPLEELSWELYQALALLAPFGYGNPEPLLVTRGLRVLDARSVGVDGRHLKLTVSANGNFSSPSWSAIAFRQGDWFGRLPTFVDLAYNLVSNEWNGRTTLQLRVQDIHPAE